MNYFVLSLSSLSEKKKQGLGRGGNAEKFTFQPESIAGKRMLNKQNSVIAKDDMKIRNINNHNKKGDLED